MVKFANDDTYGFIEPTEESGVELQLDAYTGEVYANNIYAIDRIDRHLLKTDEGSGQVQIQIWLTNGAIEEGTHA